MKLKQLLGTIAVTLLFSFSYCVAAEYSDEREVAEQAVPVAQFPDQEVKVVDEHGNWLDPKPAPAVEPRLPDVMTNSYSGVGN